MLKTIFLDVFSLSGRLTRRRYFTYLLLSLPALFFTVLFFKNFWYYMGAAQSAAGIEVLEPIAIFALVACTLWSCCIALPGKRLQDSNHAFLWALPSLFPVAFFILNLYLGLSKGTEGENLYGPDPRGRLTPGRHGFTDLMAASRQDDTKELLNILGRTKSSEINKQDDKGATALVYAVLARNPAAVRILIEHGASADIKTNGGITAKGIAENNKLIEISSLLGSQ